MEQLRLAATASRLYRVLSLVRQNQARQRLFAAVSTGRPADPDVYSGKRDRELRPTVPTGEPEEMKNRYVPETAKRDTETEHRATPSEGTEPLTPPRPPYASSPRLESTGVSNPVKPQIEQKRESTTSTITLEETICAGLDGTPWPKQQESEKAEEDDNAYYRNHKASPLSEIDIADTRKPITRATDGTGGSAKGGDVIGWLPEQLDTAEESMARARKIWAENAMRGDPDSPHGRVLRELRGEWF